jgi:hypothetical protein
LGLFRPPSADLICQHWVSSLCCALSQWRPIFLITSLETVEIVDPIEVLAGRLDEGLEQNRELIRFNKVFDSRLPGWRKSTTAASVIGIEIKSALVRGLMHCQCMCIRTVNMRMVICSWLRPAWSLLDYCSAVPYGSHGMGAWEISTPNPVHWDGIYMTNRLSYEKRTTYWNFPNTSDSS